MLALQQRDIADFIGDLHGEGLGARSVARAVHSIRGFYRFAFGDGLIGKDIAAHLDLPRQPRLLPETLTVAEVERLLQGVEVHELDAPRAAV